MSMLRKSKTTLVGESTLDSSTRSDFPCTGELPIWNTILIKPGILFLTHILPHHEITFQQDVQDLRRKYCLNQTFLTFIFDNVSVFYAVSVSEHSSKLSLHLGSVPSARYDTDCCTLGTVGCTFHADETPPAFCCSSLWQQRNCVALFKAHTTAIAEHT